MHKYTYEELLQQRLTNEQAQAIERHPVSLLLYNIRSLYNVGSIFRTADAGLAQKLMLVGYTPRPPRKEIAKTALGAVDSVPWEYYHTIADALQVARRSGMKIFALELASQSRRIETLSLNEFPLCLVLGNEITGVDDDVLLQCDGAIELPMYGVKHSLNVSVAAGIALYDAVRRWHELLK
jgi:tRNA G18 (ribose-2'-O)-methylase SpoU